MSTTIELNSQMLDRLDRDATGNHSDSHVAPGDMDPEEKGGHELTIPMDQSKMDSVRRKSAEIYQNASQTLGYGVGSVKRAATGIGAGITRAGQNVADKLQKSPRIPKSMKKRAEVDELNENILDDSDSDDDFGEDDDEKSSMIAKKSLKEVAARRKQKESKKKEENR